MIGDILSGHLRDKRVSGVIVDGAIRDTGTLGRWDDFAAFARHVTPRGPTGADLGTVNGPVSFGGTTIHPGDLILGDDDGLVCLPPETWDAGLTPAHYARVLGDPTLQKALWNTVVLAFWSGLVALLIGAPLAWLMARRGLDFSSFGTAMRRMPKPLPMCARTTCMLSATPRAAKAASWPA